MISHPALIKSRLLLQGEDSSPQLASPISADDGLPYAMMSSKQAGTETTMSPIKINQQPSPSPMAQPQDKSPMFNNVGMTITIDIESANEKSPQPSIIINDMKQPVKLRLFDIGGIGESQTHDLIMQQQSSMLTTPHTQSLYHCEAERDQQNQSKLS